MKLLNKEKLNETLYSRVCEELSINRVGGAAICVKQNGEDLFKGYFGLQDLEKKLPVTEKTIYRLASMTKPVTAFAAVMEMDKGRLDLFDPVDKYLPEFAEMNIGDLDENGNVRILGKAKTKLRLIHLLTHSSGIGASDPMGMKIQEIFGKDQRRDNFRSAVTAYSEFPLSFEPYSQQNYSSVWAFDVMGRMVEESSGKTISEYFKSEIFDPIGMTDTTFFPTEEQYSNMVYLHGQKDGENVVTPQAEGCVFADFKPTSTLCGAGLAGTLDDYVKFSEMLLNEGSYNGVTLARPEAVRAMAIPHLPESIMDPNGIWGLGMRVIANDYHEAFPKGVYGWAGAYGTHFWIDPVNKITAVYMKNSSFDGAFGKSSLNFEKDVYSCLEK